MQRSCVLCGGSGLEAHVDLSLPAPPCRLCHPHEAEMHELLARQTRTVQTSQRLDAYLRLRDAAQFPRA